MTTWTSISNAAVAVGGLPSSATVTALRDNPSALAETASGAPVMRSGWHPVDKVSVGDGKDGLIYNGAITGTVASITPSDFADGYEYRIVASGLSPSTSSGFICDVWGEDVGGYTDVIGGDGTAVTAASIEIEFPTPRIAKHWHGSPLLFARGLTLGGVTRWSLSSSDVQRIVRVRLRFSAGNITGGKAWLLRRRDYTSLP